MGQDQEWHSILRNPLFTKAADETSATLAHLSEIFVERQHLVWKVSCLIRCLHQQSSCRIKSIENADIAGAVH